MQPGAQYCLREGYNITLPAKTLASRSLFISHTTVQPSVRRRYFTLCSGLAGTPGGASMGRGKDGKGGGGVRC